MVLITVINHFRRTGAIIETLASATDLLVVIGPGNITIAGNKWSVLVEEIIGNGLMGTHPIMVPGGEYS